MCHANPVYAAHPVPPSVKQFRVQVAVIPASDAHGCANAANTRMCKNSASRNPEVLNQVPRSWFLVTCFLIFDP